MDTSTAAALDIAYEDITRGNKLFVVTPAMYETFTGFIKPNMANADYVYATYTPGTLKKRAQREFNAIRRGRIRIWSYDGVAYMLRALQARMFKRSQIIATLVYAVNNRVPYSNEDTFNCLIFILAQYARRVYRDSASDAFDIKEIVAREIVAVLKSTKSNQRLNLLKRMFRENNTPRLRISKNEYACEVLGRDIIADAESQYKALLFARELK